MIQASRADTRARIVGVAAALLHEDGPAAVTTRRVAERAGVQAPTIYRLFGDKDGLLEAVAEQVMADYVATKAAVVEAASAADVDPLDDLWSGWLTQIDFALANPALFHLFSGPGRMIDSAAAQAGQRVLESRVHRVAATGRLRVSEHRAVALVQAAGIGVIQSMLATRPDDRDPELARILFDAVLAQILTDPPPAQDHASDGPRAVVVAFRAVAPSLTVLSDGERALLREWLDRVIDAG